MRGSSWIVVSLGLACGPEVGETSESDTTGTSAADDDDSGSFDPATATLTADTGAADAITVTDPSSGPQSDSSTGDPEPLPPGGLGPWGYSFEVFDEIHADAILLADFDGDAHEDVFVQGPLAGEDALLTIWFGDGSGLELVAGTSSVVGWWQVPIAGDFDGDDRPDVAAFATSDGQPFYAALNVDGAFPESIRTTPHDTLFTSFGTAALDVNGDDAQDLFIAGGHSLGGYVYLGDGLGAFAFDSMVAGPGCYFSAVTTGDFDGDGSLELAGSGSCNSIPDVLPLVTYRVTDGALAVDQMFFEGPGVVESGDLVTVDFDDDGDLDLVTGSWPTGITMLAGDVGEGFAAPIGLSYAWESAAYRIFPVVLAADGLPAFVLGDDDEVTWAIAEQATDGELVTTPVDLEGRVVGAADLNEDGRTDVAVLIDETKAGGTLAIWVSQ